MDVRDFLRWEAASRDVIKVKRVYIDITNDLVAGVLLSQIVYWNLPDKNGASKLTVERNGRQWLAKKREDWWDECRITPKQYDRASEILSNLGLITLERFHFHGLNMVHISLNLQVLLEGVNSKLTFGEVGTSPLGKLLKTEITPEITLGFSPIVPVQENGCAAEEAGDYSDGLFPENVAGEGAANKGRELRQEVGTPLLASPSEEDVGGKKKPRTKAGDAEEVLAYLNRITGRNYRAPGQIAVRLSQGVTVKELTLVIDYLDATRGVEWKRDWFDQDAPFRKGNFDKNLEKAKGWHERRTPQRTLEPSPTPSTPAPAASPAPDVDVLAILYPSSPTRSPHAPR